MEEEGEKIQKKDVQQIQSEIVKEWLNKMCFWMNRMNAKSEWEGGGAPEG